MGILLGWAPWAAYWVLVGNTPVVVAAPVALAITVAAAATGAASDPAGRLFTVGTIATFAVLASLPAAAGQPFADRWILPLSNLALLAVVLTGMVAGRSAVRAFAAAVEPATVVHSELFDPIVTRLNRIWLGALAIMILSSAIPAVMFAGATLLDVRRPAVFVCYWVIPFAVLALAAIASRAVATRMAAGAGDAVRKTSFVAFVDMEIDQLYYLATEHANREVGPGHEVYNVTVGAKGTPLLGDATRVSWPSTFKVRDRRG